MSPPATAVLPGDGELMAGIITRLVGRAMGVAPVVHPLVAPIFAPSDRSPRPSPDPGWDSGDTTSPGALDAATYFLGQRTTPARTPRGGDQRRRPRLSRWTSGTCPRLRRGVLLAERRKPSPGCTSPPKQVRQNAGSRLPRRIGGMFPRKAETLSKSNRARTEPSHPAGSGPTRRDEAVSTAPRVSNGDLSSGSPVTEDAPVQATPRLVETRAERDRGGGVAPRPSSPGTEDPPVEHGGILEPAKATPDPLSARLALPRSHQDDSSPGNAPTQTGPKEPRVATSEPPAPTIRVTIGRVEVRAITPPPPQRETPTQTSPALSLDDYLRQHKGGQR